MGIDNNYFAWCFNNAVYYFGRSLQNELESISSSDNNAEGKRAMVIYRWLPDSPSPFKDPASERR